MTSSLRSGRSKRTRSKLKDISCDKEFKPVDPALCFPMAGGGVECYNDATQETVCTDKRGRMPKATVERRILERNLKQLNYLTIDSLK